MTARIARIYDIRATIPYDPNCDSSYIADDVKLVEEIAGTPMRLLDVGCGLGWHVDKFIERGFPYVVGVDLSSASINAGIAALSRKWDHGWLLICEDVINHRPRQPYAAICSFLSCVGSFGSAGDLQFLSTLRSILLPRGVFIMTSFYLEGVEALLGDFETQYAKDSPVTLHTSAGFDRQTNAVVFSQFISREAGRSQEVLAVEEERIRLYSTAEMRDLMNAAGFSNIETLPECRIYDAPRSIDRSGVMLTIAIA